MFEWLWYPLAFILALSLVVAVHEFGHFWVARKIGVHVIRFAVGFGPVLKRFTDRKGTEFCLCAIPLGGYVRLLDARQDEIHESQVHQEFSKKSVYARIAVYAAGPVINILLAIFVFWGYALLGVQSVRPLLVPNPEVVQGIQTPLLMNRTSDLILEIIELEGRPIQSYNGFNESLIHFAGHTGTLEIQALQIHEQSLEPTSSSPITFQVEVKNFLHLALNPIQELGFHLYREPIEPKLEKIVPGSAAEAAGWQVGDLVLALDGVDIKAWS